MKNNIFIILLTLSLYCCKKNISQDINTSTHSSIDSTYLKTKKVISHENQKKTLQTVSDFENVLSNIRNIKHTKNKYSDELSNSSFNFINEIFGLKSKELSVKTTSYTYKKNCIFFIHKINCINDSLSIKPYLESAQGKTTKGYLGVRVLIFSMKNKKTANYIDIPPNYGYSNLRTELIKKLYNTIDFDIIACDTTKVCTYKDLRKKQ